MKLLFKWLVFVFCVLSCTSKIALAGALDPWTTWATDQPYVSKQVPPTALVMRGAGTDTYYVLEVDPATGEIPVSLSGASIAIDYSGTPGSPVPSKAAYVAGTDGTNLRGIKTDSSGVVQVAGTVTANQGGAPWTVTGTGTAGSAASGVQTVQGIASMTPVQVSQATASNLNAAVTGTGTAGSAASGVVTVQGIASMTALKVDGTGGSFPVSGTVAATQSGNWSTRTQDGSGNAITSTSNALDVNVKNASLTVAASNLPTTADTNVGAAGSSTLRMVDAGRSLTTVLANNNCGSTSITTSAYVQLIASTANAVTRVYLQNTSGSILKLATGGAGVETDRLYIGPGGSGVFDITIPSSTRVALEALDATASSGYVLFTGLQ